MQGGDKAWGGREKRSIICSINFHQNPVISIFCTAPDLIFYCRAALFEEVGQVPTSPPPPTEPVPYNVLVQWK